MPNLRSLCVLAALVTCLAFESITARAATSPYYAIYVFGDSYCDVENDFAATGARAAHRLTTSMADSLTVPFGLSM